jgi:hypothetical protein
MIVQNSNSHDVRLVDGSLSTRWPGFTVYEVKRAL